jgi:2-C-methyl-D-erythritol 4-phosphate cytidylyltransferase
MRFGPCYDPGVNVCVIIAAAGVGRRFAAHAGAAGETAEAPVGGNDKLGQDLGGRPLMLRTVELFTKRDEVKSIIVAAPPDHFEEFSRRFGPALAFHGVKLVRGGRTERWETVKNALAAVPPEATHIAVHDAARPAAGQDLLDRVFDAARQLAAVIPGVPITATIKRLSPEQTELAGDENDALADLILGEGTRTPLHARRVEATIDRAHLVEVQTPQVFRADLLRRAYAQADLAGATDDAMLIERLGEPVHIVEGDVRNLKVTTPADLKLMRAVLGVQAPPERPAHLRF